MTIQTAKEALHPDQDWQDAYASLASMARDVLDDDTTKEWSTTDLANHLWPLAEGEDNKVRWRLFKGLKAIAEHDLSNYVRAGKVKRIYGQKRQSLVWQSPGYDL